MATGKAKAKKKSPTVVFECPDLYGNLVKLYTQTWSEHILPPYAHPEMAGYENLVEKLIQDPYMVQPSTTEVNRMAFVSEMGSGPLNLGVRALVHYDNPVLFTAGRTQGLVVTAYPIDLAHNAPNLGPPIYKKK